MHWPLVSTDTAIGPIAPRSPHRHFYSAQETPFSAFGLWRCRALREPVGSLISFCLKPFGSQTVELTFAQTSQGLKLTSNFPAPPCASAVASALLAGGSGRGKPSHGTFRVEGASGDTITVTLDHDGAKGSQGEVAQLHLSTATGATLAQKQGALPIVLQASLPSSGAILAEVIAVPQTTAGTGSAFRGFYTLEASGSGASEVQLEPLLGTQP